MTGPWPRASAGAARRTTSSRWDIPLGGPGRLPPRADPLLQPVSGLPRTRRQPRRAGGATARVALHAPHDLQRHRQPKPAGAAAECRCLRRGADAGRPRDDRIRGSSRRGPAKAIRWAFEQQGFYQPTGAPSPVVVPGAPPPVDVFVDDGRGGGYMPTSDFDTAALDLWCRRHADGGLAHEDPVTGAGTFVYVRVRNRGALAADGLVARVFICGSSTDRTWPDRWQPLVPHQVTAAAPLAAAGAVILGPFEWTPEQDGTHLLLADADCPDDPSNAQNTLQGKIDGVLLAHLDNNAAVRTVQVAAALPS